MIIASDSTKFLSLLAAFASVDTCKCNVYSNETDLSRILVSITLTIYSNLSMEFRAEQNKDLENLFFFSPQSFPKGFSHFDLCCSLLSKTCHTGVPLPLFLCFEPTFLKSKYSSISLF